MKAGAVTSSPHAARARREISASVGREEGSCGSGSYS